MTRRPNGARLLPTIAGAVTAVLALGACSGGSTEEAPGSNSEGGTQKLVVSTFPFGVEEFTEAVFDPFTEATGIEVEIDTGSNAERIAQLELAEGDNGV